MMHKILCLMAFFQALNLAVNSQTAPIRPSNLIVSEPTNLDFVACGSRYNPGRTIDVRNIYKVNETYPIFESLGFEVTPLEVNVDRLLRFIHNNGSHLGVFPAPDDSGCICGSHSAVGGVDAQRSLVVHMALLGNRKSSNEITWLCDGVLMNRRWVLTAAHCFTDKTVDVVRLGEYDLSSTVPTHDESPIDFGVERIVPFPEFNFPSSYHDLALIKLDKTTPYHRWDIQPVCLPWGEEAASARMQSSLILTGWGATVHGGIHSSVIQEVHIKRLNTNICDSSYKKLVDYFLRWPNGMSPETVLCAGDEMGGKDACQGDSGGPVVYENKNKAFRYTLAGIVSTGYGCGLKEFPGIYIPIDNPVYLEWIKEVAFGEIF